MSVAVYVMTNSQEEYDVVKLSSMCKSRAALVGLASVLAVLTSTVFADAGKTGVMQLAAVSDGFDAEATYRASCLACHNSGVAGAPKFGVAADWAPRLEKGFDAVFTNALNGLNAMPPKGLCFTCTDDDLKAVVQYMADAAK